jgi:hypothetical protein
MKRREKTGTRIGRKTEDGRDMKGWMDERDMEKEGHNVKRNGWALEREML